MTDAVYEPVVVSERSGAVESVHRAAVVVLGVDGSITASVGDPSVVIYPRSSNKPFQAVAMLEAGLELDSAELALACASHFGTPRHTSLAAGILARHSLTVADLRNTPDLPLDTDAAHDVLRGGGRAERLTMNCSGKHAAMLATCVVNGWSTDDYLDVDHPLQRTITSVLARLAEEPIAGIGVDGCGAPAHRISLLGLARATRAVTTGRAGAPGSRIADAMSGHPDLVGGATSEATRFMSAVPGLVAKEGAEGVMIAGLRDGRTVAFKIADGTGRARPVVLAAGLAAAGVDLQDLDRLWEVPVLGHGVAVGALRPIGVVEGWLPVVGGVHPY